MVKKNKLIFFMSLMLILILGTTSQADTNITLSEFKSLVKADGYDMDNVTFPSYFNQLLNNNPIIFYNQDKTKIMCFTGIVKANGQRDYYPNITIGIVNNQYTIGYQSGSIKTYKSPAGSYTFYGYNITDQSSYPNRYRIGCLINLSDYSFTTISSGYNGYQYYYGGVYPYIGYSYSYYQNNYTLDNFKSLAFIKSKLLENMIFYGKPLYYSNNDIFYKFDGVIKKYYSIYKNQYVNTVGQTTYNDTDLKFRYEVPATYKDSESGFMDVYLQELSPTETLKQAEELDQEGYLEKLILTSTEKPNVYGTQPVACNVYFNELIKLMEKGKIYRLRFEFFKNVKDDSGELLGNLSDTATSCFFSLNDWKSNEVEIKNIYKAVYTKDPSLLPAGDNTSSDDNINNFFNEDITKNPNEIQGALTIDTGNMNDPSNDFFTWVFDQIKNVFTSTEEQSFKFKLFTTNEYTISSSQIYVPDCVIKTLIGLAGAFGIYYWIIKDVRKTINKIKEGNIENLANEDVTANLL